MGGTTSSVTSNAVKPNFQDSELQALFGDVEFEPKHFAEGSCRRAYKGKLRKIEKPGPATLLIQGLGSYAGWTREAEFYPCVVKVYSPEMGIRLGRARPTLQHHWKSDLDELRLMKKYCELFNTTIGVQAGASFTVASPLLAKVEKRAYHWFLFFWWHLNTTVVGEWVLVEPFLKGNFEKFLSNNGWVNPDLDVNLAAAFSHFTWHASGGDLVITDIQGIRSDDGREYTLTDPAVQSRQGGCSPTDLGQDGMEAFFSTHQCNELCAHLPLPTWPKLARRISWHGQRSSTRTWQILDTNSGVSSL